MRVAKAYLAGTGATTALFAAGLVSFLLLAALLSFNGLPEGLGSSEDGSVFVGPATSAPETAAAAATDTPTAVAAAPVGVAAGGGTVGEPGGGAPESGAPGGSAPGGVEAPGTAPGEVPPGPAPPGGSSETPSTTSGPVSNTVQGVEDTANSTTGLDLPLTETTGPLTGKLDETVDGTVGGLLGN